VRSVFTDRPLRRDAAVNRGRLTQAADEIFSEQGLGAPVEQIARRAGVGMGTLYRHFPSKAALIDAIFELHLNEVAAEAERALDDPDPWRALGGFLEAAVFRQAQNRGFAEILAVQVQDEHLVARARERVAPSLAQLIESAQRAGALRRDVVYEDVSALLWTSGRIVAATRDIAPEYWRRHLALALDGLRAAAASPLPVPPLEPAQHRRAMLELAAQRQR
jgi:AcrR family transcriptional regulator